MLLNVYYVEILQAVAESHVCMKRKSLLWNIDCKQWDIMYILRINVCE